MKPHPHTYTIYTSDKELREREEIQKMIAAAAQDIQTTLEKIATDTIMQNRVKDYAPNDSCPIPEDKPSPVPTVLATIAGLLIFIAMAASNFFK